MDNRLKYFADNLDKLTIGLDDPFRFHCDQCGKCCIHRDDILLNPRDLYNMAKFLKLTMGGTVARYCEVYIGDSSRFPIVRIKPRGSVHRCPFLNDRKCSIHPAKPIVCAMFPIGRYVRTDHPLENGKLKTEYLFQKLLCGDQSETHTVREWFGAFGIPLEDTFFQDWQNALTEISLKIHKVEPLSTEKEMNLIWDLIYRVLYLNYDMEKEFEPQFQDNSRKLMEVIRKLPDKEVNKHV